MENSMCRDITSEQFDIEQEYPLLNIKYEKRLGEYKSLFIIGNIEIANIKHFNKLQKFLYKKLLGIKIEDILKGDK